jgi:hypothetical protein
MLSFFLKDVRIGLSSEIGKSNRHGVVWVKSAEGGITQTSFIVDRPRTLLNPNVLVMHSLFKQVMRLGLEPLHIEVLLNQKRTIYKYGKVQPILSHNL